MAPSTIARDVTTDPHFMLLYYALKSIEDGKPNFTKVAESMGLDTANAAAKRYARLIKVQDDAEGGGVGGGSGGNEAPKPNATPGKGGRKKNNLNVEDGGEADGDGVGGGSPNPKKKKRVTRLRRRMS